MIAQSEPIPAIIIQPPVSDMEKAQNNDATRKNMALHVKNINGMHMVQTTIAKENQRLSLNSLGESINAPTTMVVSADRTDALEAQGKTIPV
ncbi:hypothetical protein SCLCIDRAFT_1223027 [Scleroderma citrinum Foug A]|uniref:Uncharacterized protein n=1 Tax=Scleroderma citrinum Foug A TaxID=1036808 RepID=A0A0C2YNL1_9AGAM|nr:hypothetical protein SCLCIDRAFT_1224605 [Scleroderma citrinum Foug A]KIM53209.1 hypothetical protein SCLCIDRAFT_1223027 [Scleroderma citrinum Foug A]